MGGLYGLPRTPPLSHNFTGSRCVSLGSSSCCPVLSTHNGFSKDVWRRCSQGCGRPRYARRAPGASRPVVRDGWALWAAGLWLVLITSEQRGATNPVGTLNSCTAGGLPFLGAVGGVLVGLTPAFTPPSASCGSLGGNPEIRPNTPPRGRH